MDVPGFALVTGAGQGIGQAVAQTFARDGAAGVAICDINEAGLLKVKAIIEEQQEKLGRPCQVEVFQLDVTNEEQVEQVVTGAAQKFGRLDYCVNAVSSPPSPQNLFLVG